MVSDGLFLNTLLCQLRGLIISYSKKVARESREEEKTLRINIDKSTKLLDNTNLSTETRETEIVKLNSLNKQYETLRDNRMKGHQVRSRAELAAMKCKLIFIKNFSPVITLWNLKIVHLPHF